MAAPTEFERAFARAQQLHARGRLAEAEAAYRQLDIPPGQREAVLRALADLYVQARRPREAISTFEALTREAPDALGYCAQLASLLDGVGRTDDAIERYLRLLGRRPELANAHFNLALLYKKAGRYQDALAEYDEAIRLGADNVQEVYSNIGVLYGELRQAEKAASMYERALEIDPEYVPALFNRAGLFEEAGEREPALACYRRILAIDPRHWQALARLAYIQRVTGEDRGLVAELQAAIALATDPLAREGLRFALGKALDDLGRYGEAFATYRAANELGKQRNVPYDAAAVERAIDRLIEVCSRGWTARTGTDLTARPVFICGMLRSGSTLVEQVLAAHPSITAGGELDFLPRLIARRIEPYPDRLERLSRFELEQLAAEYLARVRALFPDAETVTDKRPDNFLHLGLIKALFPDARIIHTQRHVLDNCLSIFFQQLGGNLSYATDLEHIAHYYLQHRRLMAHWKRCFGQSIFTVDYDALVREPEPQLRRLLDFLGLEWDERCLQHPLAPGLVKTASVWQVREPLHPRSSGRWRNYEEFLGRMLPVSNNGPPADTDDSWPQ